ILPGSALSRSGLRRGIVRLANMAQSVAHRNDSGFARDDFEQHAFRGGLQLVIHFFRFELDDRLAARHGIAFTLEPADDVDLRGGHSACLRNSENHHWPVSLPPYGSENRITIGAPPWSLPPSAKNS